jgi:rhodanese-related sulfurtransferase
MYSSTTITGKKAKKLVDGGALLFDVRSPVQFRDGSIPGAANISPRQASSLMKHPKATKLVFFGESDDDDAIQTMVNYASQLGFLNVYTFGSIDNWGV